jgi:hypothetical protein
MFSFEYIFGAYIPLTQMVVDLEYYCCFLGWGPKVVFSGLCVKGRISGLQSRYVSQYFCICVRLRLLQEPYFS